MGVLKWVLNLIINGLPSKLVYLEDGDSEIKKVLNLIINGLPSKLSKFTNIEDIPVRVF